MGEKKITLVAGLAGTENKAGVEAFIAKKPDWVTELRVVSDAVLPLEAMRGEKDLVLVVAGTGSVAWANYKGKTLRSGGLPTETIAAGEGSGSEAGAQVLRRCVQAYDGVKLDGKDYSKSSTCSDAVEFVHKARPELRHAAPAETLYGYLAIPGNDTPAVVGQFAIPLVKRAEEGDPLAIQVVKESARGIDALISAVDEKAGATTDEKAPVIIVGSFGQQAVVQKHLSESTRRRLIPAPTGVDNVDGAKSFIPALAGRTAAIEE